LSRLHLGHPRRHLGRQLGDHLLGPGAHRLRAVDITEAVHRRAGLRLEEHAPDMPAALMRIGHPEEFAGIADEVEFHRCEAGIVLPALDPFGDQHGEIALRPVVDAARGVSRDHATDLALAGGDHRQV